MQPAPFQTPAPPKKPWWHGLASLCLGLLAVPVFFFGLMAALGGAGGMDLFGGSIAFVGLMLGAYALFTNSVAGKVMGGLGLLPSAAVIYMVLSIYG